MNTRNGAAEAAAELNEVVLEEVFSVMPDDMAVLFSHFNADAELRLAAMDDAITRGDAEALRRAAHTLKGGALGVGAQRYAADCRAMEALAECGSLAAAHRQLALLTQQLGEVMTALAQWHGARQERVTRQPRARRAGGGDE